MINKELVKFIKEARKKGFGDLTIRNALINHRWPLIEIEKAFHSLIEKQKFKNHISIFLDNELMLALKKRAKKNMLTISEQIEDILRRSALNQKKKKSFYDPKIDDKLVSLFSRKRAGRKKKK